MSDLTVVIQQVEIVPVVTLPGRNTAGSDSAYRAHRLVSFVQRSCAASTYPEFFLVASPTTLVVRCVASAG